MVDLEGCNEFQHVSQMCTSIYWHILHVSVFVPVCLYTGAGTSGFPTFREIPVEILIKLQLLYASVYMFVHINLFQGR